MLLAAFSTLMSQPSLDCEVAQSGAGKYNTKASFIGAFSVDGWSYNYVSDTHGWASEVIADIRPNPYGKIWVVVYDIPIRSLHYLSSGWGIYSGKTRFDTINIEGLNREATTIRLSEHSRFTPAKPSLRMVMFNARAALVAGIDEAYVYDTIIGQASLEKVDSEKLFHEKWYDQEIGLAGDLMREWLIKNC